MAFFARPDLSDEQFKQLPESVLSLSGQTLIGNVNGLSLHDGTNFIPIIVTGGTNFDVMTYQNGKITLKPTSGGGGGGVYSGASPTTCSVGGLNSGSAIYGKPISDILQSILVPTVSPSVSPIGFAFTMTPPSGTVAEKGSSLTVLATSSFSRGSVSPVYNCTSACQNYRSGLPNTHKYLDFNGNFTCVPTTNLTNSISMTQGSVALGNNSVSASICYDGGVTMYDSSCGTAFCSPNPLPAGITPVILQTICGVYPWFWGTSTLAPTAGQALLNTRTCKCVDISTGAINVSNFNVAGKYIWFAIPSTSPAKISWQGANNPSNNGVIPGGLFPTPVEVSVNSPELCWLGTNYKFYISNYATDINYGMTFSN